MPWVKAHRSLREGVKRGMSRATRFVYLELCDAARASGGVLRLAPGVAVVAAVHDLLGGSKREIADALRDLTDPKFGDEGAPMVTISEEANDRSLTIVRWDEEQTTDATAARRAKEYRDRRRVTRDAGVTSRVTNGDVTALEERREEEKKPPGVPRDGGTETAEVATPCPPAPPASSPRVSAGGAAFDAIREAYVAGICSVTRGTYALNSFGYRDLAAVVSKHGPPGTLAELVAWTEAKARDFATVAKATSRFAGLKPIQFGDWLNDPSLVAARRPRVLQGLPDGVATSDADAAFAALGEDGNGNEVLQAQGMK